MSYYPNSNPSSYNGGQNYDQSWGYQMPDPGVPPPIPSHTYPGAPPAFPAHPQQAPLMPQFPQFPQQQHREPSFPQAQPQSHSIYPVPNHPGYHPSYDRPPPSYPPHHSSYVAPAPYSGPPNGLQYSQMSYGQQQQQQPFQPPMAQYGHQTFFYLGTPIHPPNTPESALSVPGYDANGNAEKVKKAIKSFGTDEDALISVIAPLSAMQLAALGAAFRISTAGTLTSKLDSETSGWFGAILHGLTLGPLAYDVELVNKAIQGAGTDEQLLTEILIDRTLEDIRLLKGAYRGRYGRDLENEVQGEFSGKTRRIFAMVLSSTRPADNTLAVDHALVERDVKTLYDAGQGKIGTDEIAFCDVLVNRSRQHLSVLFEVYEKKHKKLSKVIKSEFSGQLRDTLLYIVQGAKALKDKSKSKEHRPTVATAETWGIMRDVKLLEESMKGAGTKDKDLVRRIVRLHWSTNRFRLIKRAYAAKYDKSLEDRVKSETSGDYRKLLLAVMRASA
ncbi:Annexin [Dendrothele bispora CBS 962.96]|uniref:Annexin n=1 Tax=Dendrothele bispora (strain CBS 962.96) TaxID=1314807 RepID=A0A4S8KY29_DENBC|nr:Annexin [Dendrothele bispora CBS 962.96]